MRDVSVGREYERDPTKRDWMAYRLIMVCCDIEVAGQTVGRGVRGLRACIVLRLASGCSWVQNLEKGPGTSIQVTLPKSR